MTKKSTLAMVGFIFALAAVDARAEFIMGSASGVFENPSPPDAVFSGVGTDTFTYGDPAFSTDPNRLTFEGESFDVDANVEFVIGHFTYFNARVFLDTSPTSVDLAVEFVLTSPIDLAVPITVQFDLDQTPGDGSSDDFLVVSSPSFTVFEFEGIPYLFELVGFGNVGGSGVLAAPDTLRLAEDQTATADLIGRISASPAAIPEPSGIVLLVTGVMALPMLRRLAIK